MLPICDTPGCGKEVKTTGNKCEDCLDKLYDKLRSPTIGTEWVGGRIKLSNQGGEKE